MNDQIEITPLGAGQDVGRSCILVSIGDKNIMLDCGMHMGYDDIRRFPDFSYIAPDIDTQQLKSGQRVVSRDLTAMIDAVLISHFHLDHCGALPYMTEMCGYDGPVYMTAPTRAIIPMLLDDFRRISADKIAKSNDTNNNNTKDAMFTPADVRNCMLKVKTMTCNQTITVAGVDITAFYAGHVLGAVMFHLSYNGMSVLYTGDYNTTPDRHLGAAFIPSMYQPLCVDVLITESTYATTVRNSKRERERDFLNKIYECVKRGGKVLIPTFAIGRAQELCVLVEEFWAKMGLTYPVYYSTGMTARSMIYYQMYSNWTHSNLSMNFGVDKFDFKYIKQFPGIQAADDHGPAILFASPGMLHAGFSLEVFKKWAPNPDNMIIMPGYCVPGTVGARILRGEKQIELDGQITEVKCQIKHMSFSAHADARGIKQLIRNTRPNHVVLVHGEADKMSRLSDELKRDFGLQCHFPCNGESLYLERIPRVEVSLSKRLLQSAYGQANVINAAPNLDQEPPASLLCTDKLPFSGCIVVDSQGDGKSKKIRIVHETELQEI
ncbi:hypothetical protein MIR68_003691 [Amoeboaphelidium protococcarum]|nr:hypothetical protein MIR68_003691 [Amoeboaphelidium protococcarum]